MCCLHVGSAILGIVIEKKILRQLTWRYVKFDQLYSRDLTEVCGFTPELRLYNSDCSIPFSNLSRCQDILICLIVNKKMCGFLAFLKKSSVH